MAETDKTGGLVAEAAKDRIEGDRPGRVRALLAAAAAGAAAAGVTYRVLRSGGDAGRSRVRAPSRGQRTRASRAGSASRRRGHSGRRRARPTRARGSTQAPPSPNPVGDAPLARSDSGHKRPTLG